MNVMSLDCEYNQPSHKLIQIGAAVFHFESGDKIAEITINVNPGELLNPEIITLTGITNNDLVGAINVKEAYFKLKEFHALHKCMINPLVWGSGTRNDSSMIWEEANPGEPNFMGFRVFDVKVLYQSYRILRGRGIKGGLVSACEYMGIPFEGRAHTALADAINTYKVWMALLNKWSLES